MPFLKGGRHLWPHFSQSFSDKNEEFLCSSERKFPEFCKTHPTFVSRPLLVPSMAHQTLSSIFFGTPCTLMNKLGYCFYQPSEQNIFWIWEVKIWYDDNKPRRLNKCQWINTSQLAPVRWREVVILKIAFNQIHLPAFNCEILVYLKLILDSS